jgi:AraC-like DNA-binding protein
LLLKDFIPTADVLPFVQMYRIVHLQFSSKVVAPVKAYPPRPEQCLAFYPFDKEQVNFQSNDVGNIPVVLYGQFTTVTNRIVGNNFLVLQIVFQPGGLYKLIGLPSTQIVNQYLAADIVFGNIVHQVNEQLNLANNYEAMIAIVNAFVRNLINKRQKNYHFIDDVCMQMLVHPNKHSIIQLARNSFLSTKQFERKFKERTGISPKLFESITMFDDAFRLKNDKPNYSWLKVAIECNYFDYQHLAKAYKTFTGLSPVQFHAIENKAPERLFGLVEGYYKK